jgi:predicted PurR-regulated permease PerM
MIKRRQLRQFEDRPAGPVSWALVILVTCLILYFCQAILWLVIPAFLSVILYYVTRPLVNVLMRRGWTLPSAVNFTVAVFVIGSAMLAVWLAPAMAGFSEAAHASTGRYVEGGANLLNSLMRRASASMPLLQETATTLDSRSIQASMSSLVQKHLGNLLLEMLHWVPSLILVPYLTYFLLLDGGKLKRLIVRSIPNAYFEKTLLLFHRVDGQMQAYFQGLMALTALDGVSYLAGLWLLNFQSVLGWSGIVFFSILLAILSWLPYVGSIVGALLIVLVAATDFPGNDYLALGAVGMFLLVRLLDDFVYMPMTVGRSLEVHAVVTVLMIFVGGAVAGMSGLLLVMPVLGVVMVFGEVIGSVACDRRLWARQAHARRLLEERVSLDLAL